MGSNALQSPVHGRQDVACSGTRCTVLVLCDSQGAWSPQGTLDSVVHSSTALACSALCEPCAPCLALQVQSCSPAFIVLFMTTALLCVQAAASQAQQQDEGTQTSGSLTASVATAMSPRAQGGQQH